MRTVLVVGNDVREVLEMRDLLQEMGEVCSIRVPANEDELPQLLTTVSGLLTIDRKAREKEAV